jgi:hypothetical protein
MAPENAEAGASGAGDVVEATLGAAAGCATGGVETGGGFCLAGDGASTFGAAVAGGCEGGVFAGGEGCVTGGLSEVTAGGDVSGTRAVVGGAATRTGAGFAGG